MSILRSPDGEEPARLSVVADNLTLMLALSPSSSNVTVSLWTCHSVEGELGSSMEQQLLKWTRLLGYFSSRTSPCAYFKVWKLWSKLFCLNAALTKKCTGNKLSLGVFRGLIQVHVRENGGISSHLRCTFWKDIGSLACNKLGGKTHHEPRLWSVVFVPHHFILPGVLPLCAALPFDFSETTPNVEGLMSSFIISFLFISIGTLSKKIFTLHLGYDRERSGMSCVMKKDISKENQTFASVPRLQVPYEL